LATGQDAAVGQAQATVLAVLQVTAASPLEFGEVMQGVRKSIANSNDSAAIFEISGEAGAGIEAYLQLPEYMSLSDNSDRMRISFGATDCSIDTTGAGSPSGMAAGDGWQNENPYNLPSAIVIGGSGTDFYLGGTVWPSVGQKAGSYSADIIITVAYNGN
jgi:hypothetical protein